MTIRLKPHQKIRIQSSADIYRVLQPILLRISKLNRDREHCWLMHLDASQQVRCVELLALGTQRTVLIDPMDVYHRAIVRRASSVVVIHNHPSGNLKPSHADKMMTEKLMQTSRFANVRMLDHLIISETDYFSFSDEGILSANEETSTVAVNADVEELQNLMSLEDRSERNDKRRTRRKQPEQNVLYFVALAAYRCVRRVPINPSTGVA